MRPGEGDPASACPFVRSSKPSGLAGGSRGPCSPSISLFPRSKSSRSSSRTGTEKGFLTYDEIVTGLEDVELTKEQVEDFYTYLIDHGVELVEGEQHKHPPHEQPALAEEEKRRRSST